MGGYVKCKKCDGTGSVLSHLNPYSQRINAGHGTHMCNACGGMGRIHDPNAAPAAPRAKTKPVVWYFGGIGALFGGVLQPWDIGWFFGAAFGFIGLGVVAGILSEFRIGRIVLFVAGAAFAALMVYAIATSGDK